MDNIFGLKLTEICTTTNPLTSDLHYVAVDNVDYSITLDKIVCSAKYYPLSSDFDKIYNSYSTVNTCSAKWENICSTVAANSADWDSINGGGGSSLEQAFPLSSIYITMNDATPNLLLGFGEWCKFAEGRIIIGQSTDPVTDDAGFSRSFPNAGEIGGVYCHTLSANEIPPHTHCVYSPNHDHEYCNGYVSYTCTGTDYSPYIPAGSGPGSMRCCTCSANLNASVCYNSCADVPHNNTQPYWVTYMWQRCG